jgi:hypothetical protein
MKYNKAKLRQMIMGYIDLEAYDMKNTVRNLLAVFEVEKKYELLTSGRKYSEVLANWLAGLPSTMHMPFSYYQTDDVAIALGLIERTDIDEFSNNWFNIVANELNTMGFMKKYN